MLKTVFSGCSSTLKLSRMRSARLRCTTQCNKRQEYKGRQEIEKADQDAFRAAFLADKKRVCRRRVLTRRDLQHKCALLLAAVPNAHTGSIQLITSISLSIIVAWCLVLRTSTFLLPLMAIHSWRCSFCSTLIAALDAFSEVPLMMLGRAILWKQVRYC